jgi:peptidoglycan-associated lipoprotein
MRFILACMALTLLQACARTSNDLWEDSKSAGRHMQRGVRSLGGKQGDSRQVHCRNEFDPREEEWTYAPPFEESPYINSGMQDFIPLQDPVNPAGFRPSRETPGEAGSSLPGIEAFRDPGTIPQLASLFHPIYFDYDSSLVKGQANLQAVHQIADYLRAHPRVYLFVEGHTDERGPQAYNLALGSRRSNAVRNLLINEGVHPDHLFTISYGKERPVILDRHEEGWSKNRRAEFKIYER